MIGKNCQVFVNEWFRVGGGLFSYPRERDKTPSTPLHQPLNHYLILLVIYQSNSREKSTLLGSEKLAHLFRKCLREPDSRYFYLALRLKMLVKLSRLVLTVMYIEAPASLRIFIWYSVTYDWLNTCIRIKNLINYYSTTNKI